MTRLKGASKVMQNKIYGMKEGKLYGEKQHSKLIDTVR